MFIENTEKSNLANDGTFFGKSGVAEDEATGQGDGTAGKKTAPQDRPKCLLCLIRLVVFSVERVQVQKRCLAAKSLNDTARPDQSKLRLEFLRVFPRFEFGRI